ncbi:MAG: serine/threonine protein kinase, partial [Phycisphaerales bacterium JB041]
MTPEQYERVGELFEQAVELPLADRAAFLDRMAGSDQLVRSKVASMLAAEEENGELFETPALGERFHVGDPVEAPAPTRIGRYEIEGLIGEGGM